MRLSGANGGSLRTLRVGCERLEASTSRLEGDARRLQLVERALVRRDSLAIDPGERGDYARRSAHLRQVGRRQQESQVASLAQLVNLHEARTDVGAGGEILLLQLAHALVGGGQLLCYLRMFRVDLPQLFGCDLPLEFELAQIAEQRPFLGGEPVRFSLQRLQPLGCPARERLSPDAVGLLRENRQGQGEASADQRDPPEGGHYVDVRSVPVRSVRLQPDRVRGTGWHQDHDHCIGNPDPFQHRRVL